LHLAFTREAVGFDPNRLLQIFSGIER